MSYLPCENPNCKSYGRPHPNCRCHGDMAEGGEASFCSKARLHDAGCEFFAEGGDTVPADDMPDAETVPADDLPEESMVGADVAPTDDLPEEAGAAAGTAVPEEDLPVAPGTLSLPSSFSDAASRALKGGIFREPEARLERPNDAMTDKDIQETNRKFEDAFTTASIVTGSGVAGVANKAASVAADYAKLGKIGSGVLKGMIANGLIQGGDEVSKAISGQGDPHDAVNPYLATGAATIFGGLFGGLGGAASGLATKAVEGPGMKIAGEAENLLAGIGKAASGEAVPEGASKWFMRGYNLYKKIPGMITGGLLHQTPGAVVLSKYVEPMVSRATGKAGKYAVPAVTRWLAEGAQGSVFNMIEYADKVAKGNSLINSGIDSLFKAGLNQTIKETKPSDIEKLKGYIDGGGMNQTLKEEQGSDVEGYAEGGHVEAKKSPIHADHHLAQNMPEQNVMIQAAKGRISNYLSAQRPQEHAAKLAFDDAPDDREQRKNYDRALEIAVNPLGVLHHIKKGTIEPEQVKHLNALYPELVGHLQKKITERITRDQMDGKKPSYVVRQGLSMMLGTPLSGEMTPQSIQAAQAVFKKTASPDPSQGGQQGGASAPKKAPGTALTKSDRSFLTDDQARMSRQQRTS